MHRTYQPRPGRTPRTMRRVLIALFTFCAVVGTAVAADAGTNLAGNPVPGPVHGSILPSPAPSPTGTNLTGDPLPGPVHGTNLTRSHSPSAVVHGTNLHASVRPNTAHCG